ncbi:MAG: SDR family oxidoreductase [Roseburia sp.]|nr:SDR family oxidoreductase [Roseburia sp.]
MSEQYTLITGASGGIGRELAKVFAENGNHVILVARNEKRLCEVRDEIQKNYGVKAKVIAGDLAGGETVDRVYQTVKENGWEVDTLVNNVGFGDHNCFFDTSWERQKNMLDINISALVYMTWLFGGDMRKRGHGRILNLSSMASLCAGPYMALYYASKVFVRSFSEALTEELAPFHVAVTALCPGPVSTEFEKNAKLGDSKMFHVLKVADAKAVAEAGYRGLMRGRAIVYYGFAAKLLNVVSRVFSRRQTRRVAMRINGVKCEASQ